MDTQRRVHVRGGQKKVDFYLRLHALGIFPEDAPHTIRAFGLAAGTVAAFWTSRLLRGFLFEVTTIDPVTYIAVPALVVLVAAVACYVPARRAARLDPIAALREE